MTESTFCKLGMAMLLPLLLILGSCATPDRAATFASKAGAEQRITLPGPGLTLSGVLFPPAGARRARHPAIVLLHGCSGMLDARAIPGTQQAVCPFVACHDKPWGAIAVIDRRLARDGASAVDRTWPEGLASCVRVNAFVNGDYDLFAGASPKHEDPYPLVDPETGAGGRHFLCSRNTGGGEHMALYVLDAADGSATLLHDEGTGDVGCFDPMPLAARARPGAVAVSRRYDDAPAPAMDDAIAAVSSATPSPAAP